MLFHEELDMYNIMAYETYVMSIYPEMIAHPNDQDVDGNTLLHALVLHHIFQLNDVLTMDLETIQDAINNGADLEIRNMSGKTAFLVVVYRGRKMMEKFIENNANVNVRDNMHNNALHYMALPEVNSFFEDFAATEPVEEIIFKVEDTFSMLETLLNKGVSVNLMNRRGETPLMWAARGYHLQIVRMLLTYGANVNVLDENSEAALHFAATCTHQNSVLWDERNFGILSALLRKGASVNRFGSNGGTALNCILQSGHANRGFFATEFIKLATLVHWRERMQFFLYENQILGRLRSHREIVSHADRCSGDVVRMRESNCLKNTTSASLHLEKSPKPRGASCMNGVMLSSVFYRGKLLMHTSISSSPIFQDLICN